MADTQLSLAALLLALPLNTSKSIKPQNLRDLVETFRVCFGGLYFSASALTALTAATPAKAAGTTTLLSSPAAVSFTMPANNQLKYTGAADRLGLIVASTSLTCAGNGNLIEQSLYKNAAEIPGSAARQTVVLGADTHTQTMIGVTTLSTNDEIELYLENTTNGDDCTVTYGTMLALAIAL